MPSCALQQKQFLSHQSFNLTLNAVMPPLQAAYAFKATYQNGGHGLNFSDLHDYNNHWIYATCVCAVETVLAVVLAWYLEQVLASGTGVRRHPLFFLQRRKSKGGSGERAPKLNRPWFGWLHRQGHAHSQAMPPNKVVKVRKTSYLNAARAATLRTHR